MSDLWAHSHEWDKGYCVGHKAGYDQGYADGSLAVTEEIMQVKIQPQMEALAQETRLKVIEECKALACPAWRSEICDIDCAFLRRADGGGFYCKFEDLKRSE